MNHDVHQVRAFDHPGEGRKRAKATPKGRQVDPTAAHEIEQLLGDRSRRRDLLIEHLHLIQDRYGYLSAAHLAALAQEMKLAQTEVYEVATFYAHFDVVKEDETPPPALTVRVCDSLSCAMAGAEHLLRTLPNRLGPDVRVVRAPCMGACDRAPVCAVGHVQVMGATTENVAAAVAQGAHAHAYPTPNEFERYVRAGGYALLKACLAGARTRDDIIKAVSDAGLRGLGGAGFPTGRKWTLVRAEPAPRLFAVNADEGEPGTFKDRYYLEQDPHRFIEGMLIAAWVVEAADVYIYIRDEYPEVRLMLADEIAKVERANVRIQFDFYHAQIVGGDLVRRFEKHLPLVGHVQIAAVPTRHEPDEGEVSYPAIFAALDRLGYAGWIGCEYNPRGRTEDGLSWMQPYVSGSSIRVAATPSRACPTWSPNVAEVG